MVEYRAEVTGVRLDRKKEEFTIEELALRAEEKIAEINADVELYTDGSTSGKQKRGGQDCSCRTIEERSCMRKLSLRENSARRTMENVWR